MNNSVLIVGGGIAGIQSAIDLANLGFQVYLVDKSSSIGGKMAQLDKTFPTNDCSMCILAPKMIEVGRHPNIKLLTYSEVEEVSGEVGNFRVKVKRKAPYVNWDKCTGCGECAQTVLKNGDLKEFDGEIWVDRVEIDERACIQCGECVKACLEENKEKQGLTSIALERRKYFELSPEERKLPEILMQQVVTMDASARANFWQGQLKKCIKCYGCRDICPVCICEECELEDPAWVPAGQIPPVSPLFHLIRAYHLADLCVGCGACEDTCPMGIPLRTMMHLARLDRERIFDYIPGLAIEWKEKIIQAMKERPINERRVRR